MNPYRPIPSKIPPPRYSLLVNGRRVEGERFGDVIRQLRDMGFSTEMITGAAVTVTAAPGQTLVIEDTGLTC